MGTDIWRVKILASVMWVDRLEITVPKWGVGDDMPSGNL